MRVIGLTGGIASGKSTVAGMLRELGAGVVDADTVAREVVQPGMPALEEIRARFGDSVLHRDGGLDRAALGAVVFADPEARRDLARITHPRIAARSRELLAELAAKGFDPVIYDAALIVENRLHEAMAGLIVVAVPENIQRQRLMERDRIDRRSADERLASQLPLADKVAVADWVIDNAGSLQQTRAQVAVLWDELRGRR